MSLAELTQKWQYFSLISKFFDLGIVFFP